MQEIAVAVIVLVALGVAGKACWGYIRAFRGKEPPCKHCSGGCQCAQKGRKTTAECEKNSN
ncbi:MAG: hypothetical protein IJX44_02175 [Bacteroidaceae bacterium]|nr:hypothetical protein [Bacteroidaceae bacterium]